MPPVEVDGEKVVGADAGGRGVGTVVPGLQLSVHEAVFVCVIAVPDGNYDHNQRKSTNSTNTDLKEPFKGLGLSSG